MEGGGQGEKEGAKNGINGRKGPGKEREKGPREEEGTTGRRKGPREGRKTEVKGRRDQGGNGRVRE